MCEQVKKRKEWHFINFVLFDIFSFRLIKSSLQLGLKPIFGGRAIRVKSKVQNIQKKTCTHTQFHGRSETF